MPHPSLEHRKPLVLAYIRAGIIPKAAYKAAGVTQVSIWRWFKQDYQFGLDVKYFKYAIDKRLNDFLKIACDDSKHELLKSLLTVLPICTLNTKLHNKIDKAILQVYQSLNDRIDLLQLSTQCRDKFFDLVFTENNDHPIHQHLLNNLLNNSVDIISKPELMMIDPVTFFRSLTEFKVKLQAEFQMTRNPDIRAKIVAYHSSRLIILEDLLNDYNIVGTTAQYLKMLSLAQRIHNVAGDNIILILIESLLSMQEQCNSTILSTSN